MKGEPVAITPNNMILRGKLQIVFEGREDPIELGEVEIPIALDFKRPNSSPTFNIRGEARAAQLGLQ